MAITCQEENLLIACSHIPTHHITSRTLTDVVIRLDRGCAECAQELYTWPQQTHIKQRIENCKAPIQDTAVYVCFVKQTDKSINPLLLPVQYYVISREADRKTNIYNGPCVAVMSARSKSSIILTKTAEPSIILIMCPLYVHSIDINTYNILVDFFTQLQTCVTNHILYLTEMSEKFFVTIYSKCRYAGIVNFSFVFGAPHLNFSKHTASNTYNILRYHILFLKASPKSKKKNIFLTATLMAGKPQIV